MSEPLDRIRDAAEDIIALASGPWSEGQGLPPLLSEAMIVRSEHYRRHAQEILDAVEALVAEARS